MITFNETGTIQIDGFPDGAVSVNPPTFGGLKRLRAERVRAARDAEDAMAAWDEANALIGTDDEPVDLVAMRRHDEDRLIAVQDANHDAAVRWWRLVLIGDDSFKRLAEGSVPDDSDEWPPGLIFDVRPLLPSLPQGQTHSMEAVLAAQSLPDQLLRFFGRGRSRYSSGSSNGQVTDPSPLVL